MSDRPIWGEKMFHKNFRPLAPATHVSSGSAQLCVQGSFTDQTIELGIRTVESRQWLVRPWGTASAAFIIDRP